MYTFEEDEDGFMIYENGVLIFDITPPHPGDNTPEERGMVACMVDALNKEQGPEKSEDY